jgi:hypothetical protein
VNRYVFGTAVVTSAVAANLREFSRRLEKDDCDGMFIASLSANGLTPATHYISSGWIPRVYAETIRDATLLYTRAKKAWEDDGAVFPYTQTQVTNALSQCDITAQDPQTVMTRLGLQPVRVP